MCCAPSDWHHVCMADAVSRYQAGCETKNFDALADTLAPHVELLSPISGRMVFRGAADVSTLLAAVYGSLDQLNWREEIGEGAARVLVSEGRVFGVMVHDALILELTADGQIQRIRPHLRPWLALTLVFVRLFPAIARNPGIVLRALQPA
jgi:hypothetical protein